MSDLTAFLHLPRLTGLALHPDGSRLVASVQAPDERCARYVSALWEIPLDGGSPHRLTRSENGESSPVFRPDGTLLFVSSRPGTSDDDASGDDAALWSLPPAGEPHVLARRPGGLGAAIVARESGTTVLTGSRLVGSSDADDGERRTVRNERKVSAILHDGMPIRYWDHELGAETTRLLMLEPGSTELVDLAPDVRTELDQATCSISADGTLVATRWRPRGRHGHSPEAIAVIDTATRTITHIEPDGWEQSSATIAPDGSALAVLEERSATYADPIAVRLAIVAMGGAGRSVVELGDLFPSETAWSTDSSTLFVAGDLHGRGAVLAIDPVSGHVRHRLVADAAYSALCPSPDGSLYALRSAMDEAPVPVRLETGLSDQTPTRLPTPAPTPALPGRLTELDGVGPANVHAWLFTPEQSEPAPLMVWIHGGPIASYNSWSWRWNPWIAVANGWAVVLPDPALSTGYGQSCIDRAWPYLADVVWAEVESVLDEVAARPEIDHERTALLGGSFGGFMTNWIAGHATRFGAIVTHAGLWALDQQHATTDAADYKTGVFGRLEDHPEWYAQYSPHNSVDAITTPMLIVHGNRDYRVPVSEALRLWWDLVSRWDGEPDELPHRFLQFTSENHWILSPANAEIWYETVLDFCARHVLRR